MKVKITCGYGTDTLDRQTQTEIEDTLFKFVKQYFINEGASGRPRVSEFKYDILHFTFKIPSEYYSMDCHYFINAEDTYELNEFRSGVRKYLKSLGFNHVKFDFRSYNHKYEWWGGYRVDKRKEFVAIYFDR